MIVVMILRSQRLFPSMREAHLPDEFVPSIPDQFYATGSPAFHIEEVASQLDEAELNNDDYHRSEERGTEDFGMEAALQAARETAEECVGD